MFFFGMGMDAEEEDALLLGCEASYARRQSTIFSGTFLHVNEPR